MGGLRKSARSVRNDGVGWAATLQERKRKKKSACSVRNDGVVVGVEGGMRKGLEIQAEVIPFGVEGFDQGDFLGTPPLFDFFFT